MRLNSPGSRETLRIAPKRAACRGAPTRTRPSTAASTSGSVLVTSRQDPPPRPPRPASSSRLPPAAGPHQARERPRGGRGLAPPTAARASVRRPSSRTVGTITARDADHRQVPPDRPIRGRRSRTRPARRFKRRCRLGLGEGEGFRNVASRPRIEQRFGTNSNSYRHRDSPRFEKPWCRKTQSPAAMTNVFNVQHGDFSAPSGSSILRLSRVRHRARARHRAEMVGPTRVALFFRECRRSVSVVSADHTSTGPGMGRPVSGSAGRRHPVHDPSRTVRRTISELWPTPATRCGRRH